MKQEEVERAMKKGVEIIHTCYGLHEKVEFDSFVEGENIRVFSKELGKFGRFKLDRLRLEGNQIIIK